MHTLLPFIAEQASQEFVQERLASAQSFRQGDPTGISPAVAFFANRFARGAARVERWARGSGESAQSAIPAAR